MKNVLLAGLLCSASLGSAQGFRFDLAYGDAATAALNNKSVGDFLDPNGITKIGAIGSQAVFQYWITPFESRDFTGGNIFVGFDMATANNNTNYASNAAAQLAGLNKKLVLADAYENYATGLPCILTDGTPIIGNIQAAVSGAAGRASFRASRIQSPSAMTIRSIGLNFQYGVGTSTKLRLTENSPLRVMDLRVKNASMSNGEVFGDAPDENGLTLNRDAFSVANGANYLTGYYGAPSLKYQIQAVPEPGTILALSAGVVALARRRKM